MSPPNRSSRTSCNCETRSAFFRGRSSIGEWGAEGSRKMLSFDPALAMKMPRVVVNQKSKFETDEFFKKLSRESEVRYTGFRDRPMDERRSKFRAACREGYTEVAFVSNGTNFQLLFGAGSSGRRDSCHFDQDKGKVHIRSSFILNGVCVRWRGSLDLDRLDGLGCLEFDSDLAKLEDDRLQQQLESYNERIRNLQQQRAFLPTRTKRMREQTATVEELSPCSTGSASN